MFHVKRLAAGRKNPRKAKQRPDCSEPLLRLWMWGVKEKDMDI